MHGMSCHLQCYCKQYRLRNINTHAAAILMLVYVNDISAADFQPPVGYTLEALLTRIHFFDGHSMQIGFNATVAYWRAAGLKKTAAILNLPGIRHIGNVVYNIWAQWRRKNSSSCNIN